MYISLACSLEAGKTASLARSNAKCSLINTFNFCTAQILRCYKNKMQCCGSNTPWSHSDKQCNHAWPYLWLIVRIFLNLMFGLIRLFFQIHWSYLKTSDIVLYAWSYIKDYCTNTISLRHIICICLYVQSSPDKCWFSYSYRNKSVHRRLGWGFHVKTLARRVLRY